MPEGRKRYSDYTQNLSNVMNGLLFFAGFTFTVVAILLTSFPNLRTVQSQFILLFLTAIFYLTIFIAIFLEIEIAYYSESIPPLTRRVRIANALLFLTFLMIGLAFPLLFLLWDLTSLATISGLIWVLFAVSLFLFVFRPFQKWRKGEGKSGKIEETNKQRQTRTV